ncbi:NADP-dependent oxidoreductase domain-containing protein [Rhodotorula toruloides]|uniref:NADP-dependent oxidoreductase domain-containing protein n=1 Tax=Rhodotorula toruloides TaxID=5286 RepID=A0A2T0AB09_RHOTO|nr:NADP-dependent oxidoreductase domain-containing protein [Rhodotorula toruloides]
MLLAFLLSLLPFLLPAPCCFAFSFLPAYLDDAMSADDYNIESRVQLNDGETYPRFGLGVYVTEPGAETYNALTWALEVRAEWYENEESCGKAIRDFMERTGTPRSEIFFTTKLMHNKTDPAWVEHCVDVSTQKAGISPDLYLIHDPNGGPEVRAAMWEGCCRVKDKGKVKSIGVSNFGVKHLEDLLAGKPKYVPAVNQIDLHPFMTRNELVAYCESQGIVLEAWAPLVRGLRFKHPVVVEIAEKYKKSPAQVLIRYGLDRGFIVIPKSTHKERIIDNANVFDFKLEKADLDRLTSLDEFLVTDWEVSTVP